MPADPELTTGTVDAPAKINLALHVTGQRKDGYHELDTLCIFAGAGDRLTLQPAPADSLILEGPFAPGLAGLPDTDNLVVRARDLLRDAITGASGQAPPVAIRLEKNLPASSGMGGGSADAAATLALLGRHWHDARLVGPAELHAIGCRLGADVPMCRLSVPLRARGIGDLLETVDTVPAFDLVIANPGVPVATPAVFRALRSRHNPPLPEPPASGDLRTWTDWLSATRNDLQDAATRIAPAIGDCLAELASHKPLFVRMTGSGATCFAICRDREQAETIAGAIAATYPDWFCVAARSGASGRNKGRAA